MVATCKLSLSFVQPFINRSFFLFYYYCMTTFVIKLFFVKDRERVLRAHRWHGELSPDIIILHTQLLR